MTMIIGCDLAGAQAFDVAGITNTVGALAVALTQGWAKCGCSGSQLRGRPKCGTDGTFPFFLLRKEWDRAAGEPAFSKFPQRHCDI